MTSKSSQIEGRRRDGEACNSENSNLNSVEDSRQQNRRRRRNHRHTPEQIQEMEEYVLLHQIC